MEQWFSPTGLQGVVVLTTAISSFYVYFRRRKQLKSRTIFNIYDDVRTSLEQLKKTQLAFPEIIKAYEEDSSPDNLIEMPFFSFCTSARLADIFNENADLLKHDEARAIAKFLDMSIGFESMVVDSKREAFFRISKKRKMRFYALMLATIEEMITAGDKITERYEPMFGT